MNTVEPIRSMQKIKEIKEYLREKEIPRNYLLFVLGINSALRISDMLGLKVKDVQNQDGTIKEKIYLRESKTNKEKTYTISQSAEDALGYYFSEVDTKQADWLFPSRTHDRHINRSWAWRLVKDWTEHVGLEGNYGTHSLRKTFGYMARKEFNEPIELIQAKFNHSSPAVTRRYIGIDDEEIAELEERVNL